MPHVIVKLWPGKTEKQKKRLAKKLTEAVMSCFGLRRGISFRRHGRSQRARLAGARLQA
jgi:hypothetical protein